jgi:hypothetical protein
MLMPAKTPWRGSPVTTASLIFAGSTRSAPRRSTGSSGCEGLRSEFSQKLAALHGSTQSRFNQERALTSRIILKKRQTLAPIEWRKLREAQKMPDWGKFRDNPG